MNKTEYYSYQTGRVIGVFLQAYCLYLFLHWVF